LSIPNEMKKKVAYQPALEAQIAKRKAEDQQGEKRRLGEGPLIGQKEHLLSRESEEGF